MIEISDSAFANCLKLRSINFEKNSKLQKIGFRSFYYCIKLTNINFPPLLEIIKDEAFYYTKIKEFDLQKTKVRHFEDIVLDNPGTVISLPANISLKSIMFIEYRYAFIDDEHPFAKRDECGNYFLFKSIFRANKELEYVLIRRGIERISENCFYESDLISITIPASVIEISNNTFSKCEFLEDKEFTLARNQRQRFFSM